MSWNYRMVRTYTDLPSGEVEECVAIHEVYYDKQGLPNGYTADAVAPHGETWVAFLRDWENWTKAVDGGESKILDSRHDFNGRATPGETEGAK